MALRAADNLAAWALQGRANAGGSESGARHAAGGIAVEVDRLKRGGLDVQAIEYYAADLERSLRPGQQDATASRHILNNLDYEIEALRRRSQR